ncbi:MAG: class II glutamine amidotransferase [Planctomycetota bacterium]|jgi:ergothioneine biosynthesis protein EgtC
MCRFALYLGAPIRVGSLVTEPLHSIIRQSVHSRETKEPLNGDGFGIAWYVPSYRPEPAIFKDVSPAWSNQNLRHLADVTSSRCILAHVRAATAGIHVAWLNCHPFSRHRFAFMHNGHVGGFRKIQRALLSRLSDDAFEGIQGSTDSEHLFALFAEYHAQSREADPLERMVDALVETIRVQEALKKEAGVEATSLLNMAVADGERAVAVRYASRDPVHAHSLYVYEGGRYVCEEGNTRMDPAPRREASVLVASEPLSNDPGWHQVPSNHLVVVRDDRTAELRALPT